MGWRETAWIYLTEKYSNDITPPPPLEIYSMFCLSLRFPPNPVIS